MLISDNNAALLDVSNTHNDMLELESRAKWQILLFLTE